MRVIGRCVLQAKEAKSQRQIYVKIILPVNFFNSFRVQANDSTLFQSRFQSIFTLCDFIEVTSENR